jgi:hypothetical protein
MTPSVTALGASTTKSVVTGGGAVIAVGAGVAGAVGAGAVGAGVAGAVGAGAVGAGVIATDVHVMFGVPFCGFPSTHLAFVPSQHRSL